jgi:hypothetical protein
MEERNQKGQKMLDKKGFLENRKILIRKKKGSDFRY